jgi:hypothetical protein
LLLSRIIGDRVEGDHGSVIRFARRELFYGLGVRHVTLEFDGAGTPVGSSHCGRRRATGRVFGLLYVTDGVVGDERVLPRGWVNYSARVTPGSEDYGYGAGF